MFEVSSAIHIFYASPANVNSLCNSRASQRDSPHAFSLVELLVVIAVMALLMGLVAPAFLGIKGASDLGSATSEISGLLEQSRAYAMAQNTYVYVGIQEVDANVASGNSPQVAGTGRVVVAVVASKEGTRIFNASTNSFDSNKLVPISKLRKFENLHLGTPSDSGNMARPSVPASNQVSDSSAYDLNSAAFAWPLEGTAIYKFFKIIEFDPQGTPRPLKSGGEGIVDRLELGLLQSKGNIVVNSAQNPAQQSAIQLDGVTGATRIYRP